ncbi:MAG: TlpA family protein disulfide reductase [Gaiellaceae bacterium MAG52_C11]|nr:TlpA family protein disulfide reductase [Candidatus Gaiellasilicea maunaloa]
MSRRSWMAAVGIVATLALVVGGVMIATRGDAAPAVAATAATPALPVAGIDPVTGKNVSLADFAGKPVVINVWASWCPPCHAEAADLARFARAHPEVQLLGIDILDSREGARDFYRQYELPYPSVFDPGARIALSFGLQGQPITYFLNARHEIVGRIIGGSDLAGFESALRTALA